MLVGLG